MTTAEVVRTLRALGIDDEEFINSCDEDEIRELLRTLGPNVPKLAAVLRLEEEVSALTKKLKDFEADPAVPRDYLGTLYVNLAALARAATLAMTRLDREHGFG
jgi:hypothetical protein